MREEKENWDARPRPAGARGPALARDGPVYKYCCGATELCHKPRFSCSRDSRTDPQKEVQHHAL